MSSTLRYTLAALLVFVQLTVARALDQPANDRWIRPTGKPDASPVWGIKDGIAVGLSPTPGPRGLIRIYTPYLGQPPGYIDQYIAVEPIVAGQRDLSEIQTSQVDKNQGKMMWTADTIDPLHPPTPAITPARGLITSDIHSQSLSFYIDVERFNNGAHPVIKLTIHSDRPHELTLQTFAAADSAPMQSCVLTATMGNMSRLRHLFLQKQIVHASALFQDDKRGYWDFYPWHEFKDLPVHDDLVTFAATGEVDGNSPDKAPPGWTYQGVAARQYWQTKPCPRLLGRVNGRSTFWASHANIPGGVAFENFELLSPFAQGQTFYFGVEKARQ